MSTVAAATTRWATAQRSTGWAATSCGEASHPDRSRALRKALLEFCGSRSRKAATHGPIEDVRRVMAHEYVEKQIAVAVIEEEENRALEAMAEWVAQDAAELRRRLAGTVFSERRRVPLSSLPDTGPEAVAESSARLRLLDHAPGDPVGAEDHDPAGRHVVGLVDEHGALGAEVLDDGAVVDDLVPDVDRRPVQLERQVMPPRPNLQLEIAAIRTEQEELDDLVLPEAFTATRGGRGKWIAVPGRVDAQLQAARRCFERERDLLIARDRQAVPSVGDRNAEDRGS